MPHDNHQFVSRAGLKLAHALDTFGINPSGLVCADLGSNTGGFVDCLLQRGAAKVYAVERGYGVLALSLRNDPRVVVMERTDALHVRLPEPISLVTIDTGWTRQQLILPVAMRLLGPGGRIISLIKPHYEAPPELLRGGVLPDDLTEEVLGPVRKVVCQMSRASAAEGDADKRGLQVVGEVESPIRGQGGNRELLWLLQA